MKKTNVKKTVISLCLVCCMAFSVVTLTSCGGDTQIAPTTSKVTTTISTAVQSETITTNNTTIITSSSIVSTHVKSEEVKTTLKNTTKKQTAVNKTTKKVVTTTNTKSAEIKGIWLSFYEISFSDKSETAFIRQFNEMMQNIENAGFNAVFVHVRSHADAYYPSKYFPWSYYISGKQGVSPGYDPLKIMVKLAHNHGLQFHAWINPFRVSSGKDLDDLSADNQAKKWLTDNDKSNDTWVKVLSNGIYFNPAIPQVRSLVINGAKEIVKNYDVDGLHMDDYFYPTTAASFDKTEYDAYCKTTSSPMGLADYRRDCVNKLVRGLYSAVKAIDKSCIFGISPQANVDNNYYSLYADVAKWSSSKGYIDYIAPQIYFGFLYDYTTSSGQNMAFDKCAKYWQNMVTSDSVKLYIGLGLYRSGTKNDLSGKAQTEWIDNTDIIKRQIEYSKTLKSYGGVIVFSYSSMTQNDSAKKETENMIKALKKK